MGEKGLIGGQAPIAAADPAQTQTAEFVEKVRQKTTGGPGIEPEPTGARMPVPGMSDNFEYREVSLDGVKGWALHWRDPDPEHPWVESYFYWLGQGQPGAHYGAWGQGTNDGFAPLTALKGTLNSGSIPPPPAPASATPPQGADAKVEQPELPPNEVFTPKPPEYPGLEVE